MIKIEEYQADIVAGREVTEGLCIEIINFGSDLVGYGLFLAKTKVHKDSNTGWEKFCDKVNKSKRNADRQIEYYIAKSGPMGPDLPDKERQFRELPGETVEEKVQNYNEVKEMTHKEKPTALDIEIVNKIEYRNISDTELTSSLQEYLNTASNKIRVAFSKIKKATGFNKIVDNKDILTEDQMVTLISKNILPDEVETPKKPTKTQKTNANKSLADRNEALEAENKILKDRIKELEEGLEKFERMNTFILFTNRLQTVMMQARALKTESENSLRKMSPEIKRAFELLGVEQGVTDETFRAIKKAYRHKAKEHHPDLSQNNKNDYFMHIKDAYEKLKDFHNSIGAA